MQKKKYPLFLKILLIVGLTGSPIQAFQTIRGSVVNENLEPVPYVNIGIVGKTIGTVSNADGKFQLNLKLTSENINDTLLFSSVGFKSVGILLGELELDDFKVILKKETYELEDIEVLSEITKSKTFGIKRRSPISVSAYVQDDNLGSEFVNQFVNNKKARVDKFSILITNNPFPKAYFRVNVYEQEDGGPGKNILRESIYVDFERENGWLEVDLSKYNIFVEGNFFVGVEWIEEIENVEKRRLYVGGKLVGPKRTWVRAVSQSEWEKVEKVTLTMNATISY